jgi:hypothetical protein
MAGKIIVSTLQSDTDNSISFVANTGATIFSANISHGIAGSFIANGSITGAKIALGTITGDDIATGQITGNLIATGQITGNLIATNAISQNNIVSVNASVASVGTLPKARLPAGTVLQVVSNTKTDTFTTSSTTDVAITGLFATITPTSASSKILVLVNIGSSGATTSDYGVFFSLYRSASVITGAVGDAASSRKVCSFASRNSSDGRYQSSSIMHQDSPASTSSLTYACYVSMESGGGTACINRSANDTNAANFPRTISSITVMEIAG